mgnify:CR=1 FL=1
MRQSTIVKDCQRLCDLRAAENSLIQSNKKYTRETDLLQELCGADICPTQDIVKRLDSIKHTACVLRGDILRHKRATVAWKKTPAKRRKSAETMFRYLKGHIMDAAHAYSGNTSYDIELTEHETSAETTTWAGERYTVSRFDRKTDARHKVRINIKDFATIVGPLHTYTHRQAYRQGTAVKLKQIEGLAKASEDESVYEASWVQSRSYKLVLKTGYIAYNHREQIEYHLEGGDPLKALTGLRRKVTMSKSDPNKITPKKGKVTIGQVISKTGWCRPGCEEFAERMLGRLADTAKGYDVHKILRVVERIISKGDTHTYYNYAVRLKKMLGHAEVASAVEEVAA